jgi:MFS family permease
LAPELDLAADQMGWVFFVSNLMLAAGASIGGVAGRRSGRKPVLIGAVAALGMATLATCFVTDFNGPKA